MNEKFYYRSPISNIDIKKYLKNVNIINYGDLGHYDKITDLLPKQIDACVIFVKTTTHLSGHWCAILRKNQNIYYFDAYGLRVDKNLFFQENSFIRNQLNQNIPHLSYLLNDAIKRGFKVFFNEVKYQDDNKAFGSATCGRWVVYRILKHFEGYTPKTFKNHIKKLVEKYELKPDFIITKLIKTEQEKY
jgi:hypothetical protein